MVPEPAAHTTYPNRKIYIGKNLTGSINHFESAGSDAIATVAAYPQHSEDVRGDGQMGRKRYRLLVASERTVAIRMGSLDDLRHATCSVGARDGARYVSQGSRVPSSSRWKPKQRMRRRLSGPKRRRSPGGFGRKEY